MSLGQAIERATRRLGDAKAVGQGLDLSWRTVYRLADAGKIPPGYKLGASRRWDLSEIEDFIAGGCKPPRRNPSAGWARVVDSHTLKAIASRLGALWAVLRLATLAVEHLSGR
jgi:predicted DNA-binding transcriptional regulator AlpA